MRDRRAVVFIVFAVVCFALTPVAERDHRWVSVALGVIYLVLAVASALDAVSRSRR